MNPDETFKCAITTSLSVKTVLQPMDIGIDSSDSGSAKKCLQSSHIMFTPFRLIPSGSSNKHFFVISCFDKFLFPMSFFGDINRFGVNLDLTNIVMITAAFSGKLMCFVVRKELFCTIRSIKLRTADVTDSVYTFFIDWLLVRVRLLIHDPYIFIYRIVMDSFIYRLMISFTGMRIGGLCGRLYCRRRSGGWFRYCRSSCRLWRRGSGSRFRRRRCRCGFRSCRSSSGGNRRS